jgi:hypothetical protein
VWQQFLLGRLDAKEALKLAERKVREINAQAGR